MHPMLETIYQGGPSIKAGLDEVIQAASDLQRLENELGKLFAIQDKNPDLMVGMEGLILSDGDTMAVNADVPIGAVIEAKKRELDAVLNAFNRASVEVNATYVKLVNFIPEAEQTDAYREAQAKPEEPVAEGLQTDSSFKFEGQEAPVKVTDTPAPSSGGMFFKGRMK